jgi:hypothetical protein
MSEVLGCLLLAGAAALLMLAIGCLLLAGAAALLMLAIGFEIRVGPAPEVTRRREMERAEWERRFKQRLIDKGGTTPEGAQAELDGGVFEDLLSGFEDDPEGSADEAMSYWEE